MQIEQFAMMNLLSADKARELVTAINEADTGQRMLGSYDTSTGFCVRVYLAEGMPIQWFIRGPLTLEQAREELMGPQPPTSGMVH